MHPYLRYAALGATWLTLLTLVLYAAGQISLLIHVDTTRTEAVIASVTLLACTLLIVAGALLIDYLEEQATNE